MTAKAPFIVLEGPDGGGKTVQSRLLADWLRGRGLSVVTTLEPGGTPFGQKVRALVLEAAEPIGPLAQLFLFMASRAELVRAVIRPALDAGAAVVCDRFLLSSVAYQGHADGVGADLVWDVGRAATGGLEPDLTVVLDVPAEVALPRRQARGVTDRFEGRGAEFHERVRRGFLAEAARRPDRIAVVDARGGVGPVQDVVRGLVARLLDGPAPA